jgi:homoserine kinase
MMVRSASVSVPGSTSNLGGGFDCVGMAIDRWLHAHLQVDQHGSQAVTIARDGTLRDLTCDPSDDLLYQGFAAACVAKGRAIPSGLTFAVTSEIPVARGLGSSAAALVAGAALADVTLDLGLAPHGIATLISQVEGHPDNAAPAALGGAMLGVARDDAGDAHRRTYVFASLPVHPSLAFVFAVPSLEVTTASARAVLPAEISFTDAVCVVQRSAALIHGLAAGHPELLARALDDVLHVPYRRSLVPAYDAVVAAARGVGAFGATLSGSGSAILAICHRDAAQQTADAMRQAFALKGLTAETLLTTAPVPGYRISTAEA